MEGFSVNVLEATCLGVSIALSGLSFYLYKKGRTTVDKLDNAPQFITDKSLKAILKQTPGARLEYVIIEGAVEPAGRPLMSQYNRDAVGVLRTFMVKDHRLLWNGISRSWIDDERIVHKNIDAVPFLLVGLDKTEVRVKSPLQASGLNMEITHERFHQASHSLFDIMVQYLSGEKPRGQLEIEKMLRVGTNLTGIGELTLDTDGILTLQPPSNGSQYFLSTADFKTLRGENEILAFWWKVLGITSALAGAAVLFWVGLRYYRQLKLRWEQEQESREFNRQLAEDLRLHTNVTGPDDHQDTANLCVICLNQPRNCVLLDCGHMCCCYTCYQALPQRKCPICRQNIVRVLPLYQV
ncbi:mitochondrial ubiquitin ligase activator of nfkb 1-A [Archocentrus centrarchus]|uniref:mitochondrial ubiquitin ligase activator of nfkb 1-A n=1 Tax=Archocentrus centrarchus TaxID=63155 RepID=UPI0011E9FCF5|nr:mitochondrial ubiquitin ligase activator of nfkb 1-A-like [Archocentrus centrarchus]